MWSAVTPASAAAATTLALLEEYVIFNLTADSSGQLYTKTENRQEVKGEMIDKRSDTMGVETTLALGPLLLVTAVLRAGSFGGRGSNACFCLALAFTSRTPSTSVVYRRP